MAWTKFYCLTEDIAKGEHDFETDNFTMMWTNTAPALTAVQYDDIVQIAGTGGYTTGGKTMLGLTLTSNAGVTIASADNVEWTAETGGMGPLRYPVIYNGTNNRLIAFNDNGISITVPDTQKITVVIDPAEGYLRFE